MEQKNNTQKNYYTIDLMHILKALWQRAWIIVIVTALAGVLGFCVSEFVVAPEYSSSVLLYVNNGSMDDKDSITSSDIKTSQILVQTYTEILKNRTTLEQVAHQMDDKYTYGQLNGMITASSSNETEVMKITVTANDPTEAANIANTIALVLPGRISEIITGATMKVVDSAVPNNTPVSPSVSGDTVKFAAVGFLIAAFVIAIFAMLDDTIHDEEYLLQNYKYPILAKIPNLLGADAKHYGYKNGKYYYTKPLADDDNV